MPSGSPSRPAVHWIGVLAGTATLALFVVTAFVTPGFLVGDGGAAAKAPSSGPSEVPTSAPPAASPPSSTPSLAGPEAGRALVDGFLGAVNAKDAAGAMAALCLDSAAQVDIEDAVENGAQVRPDPATEIVDDEFLAVDLAGRVDGHPVTGRVSAFQNEPGTWCVYTFYAI
jgi:hypothetical protein